MSCSRHPQSVSYYIQCVSLSFWAVRTPATGNFPIPGQPNEPLSTSEGKQEYPDHLEIIRMLHSSRKGT